MSAEFPNSTNHQLICDLPNILEVCQGVLGNSFWPGPEIASCSANQISLTMIENAPESNPLAQVLNRMAAQLADLDKKTVEIRNLLDQTETKIKSHLSLGEAASYTGFSRSTIYKAVERGDLCAHKPGGHRLVLLKADLDSWLLQNRSLSRDETQRVAATYLFKKGGAKAR